MTDAHTNFAGSLVATAPSPAASGTSLVVTATEGALFPAVPFNATVWPVNTQPTAANAEIVRVTVRASDTFTITRAQEGSSARTVIVGDQICATITNKTLTDVEATGNILSDVLTPAQITANTDNYNPTGLATASVLRLDTDAARNITGIAAPTNTGRLLLLENIGSFKISLIHDQTSTAANRFAVGNAAAAGDAWVLAPGNTAMLRYDSVVSRWSIVNAANRGVAVALAPTDNTGAAGTSNWFAAEDHKHPSPIYAATSTYTPTLTQSGAVTKSTTYAHYWQIGKLVIGWVTLAVTGSGSAGTAIAIGLPVTASSANQNLVGTGYWNDASPATNYPGVLFLASTTTLNIYRTETPGSGAMGVSPSLALANGDTLYVQFVYEAA